MFKSIKIFVLDILFPLHCLFCQKYGQWICQECFKKISLLPVQVCPYCEKAISPAGRICFKCKEKFLRKNQLPPLDALIVSTKYEKNGASRLIHHFKYSFVKDLGDPLAKIMSEAITFHNLPLPDLIIPVPLHSRRLRWRGFNQSEILANHICENLTPGFSIPVISNLLLRKKYTQAQMKIKNYQERQKNVKNIFTLSPSSPVIGRGVGGEGKILKDKTILLIDDVATTGATLFECARTLKSAGAKKVYGAIIARQEIHPVE